MKTYKRFGTLTCVAALLILLSACSGGSDGSGNNANSEGPDLNANEQAFANTLHPVLTKWCAGCHSEQSSQGVNVAHFAHSNIVIAHAVITNRNLVDLKKPSASRFVERLSVDKHQCWSDCAVNAQVVQDAIENWNAQLASGGNQGGLGNKDPLSSSAAFAESVHPLVQQYCADCHDANGGYVAFAHDNSQTAHDVTVQSNLADLENPVGSKLVTMLANNDHNCWSDCATNASRIEGAIAQWAQLLSDTGGGNGNNRAPIAVNDAYTTSAGISFVTGNVFVNDSDPDGDTLAISAFQANSNRGGQVVNNVNGTFNYSPANGFTGNDWFDYTITDGEGGFATARVSISVTPNNGPVARADSVKTNQNTVVRITTLLANDISSSGNALSIVSVDRLTENGGATQLSGNNAVTYTPPTDYTGIDRFNYTASDGQGVSSAQVQVDINAQPVAVSDAIYTYIDLTANTGNVLNNDIDTNGDLLTIGGFDSASVQAGTVSYNGDGTFTYDPPRGFQGSDSFDYIVLDGRGGTATATVFIAVTDQVLRDDNRFLLFLNQTAPLFDENEDTARAYYRAIDPLDQRTTLNAWRNLNGFNIGADAFAVYINNNDLGFARRMFVRTDQTTGVVSSYVENYATLADALNEVNLIATVAMEHNVAPGQNPLDTDAPRYASFYVFDGNDNRALGADLDGRGFKFIPGLCNTCHGGRPGSIVNGIYTEAGDTGAKFIPWDLDTYLFSDQTASVSRSQQEAQFKIFNQTVLRTDPLPATKQLIEGWYGGVGLPANNFNGQYVPPGWLPPLAPANATQLYLQVVAPGCRACHMMRGSPLQNDIDFASYDKFVSYTQRIEQMVYDEGTMPLARRTWDRFWEGTIVPQTLARFLNSSRQLEDDELLLPGRVISNPGPFREAAIGRVNLNGNGSLYTGGNAAFSWQLVQRPAESLAILQNANQADAFFVADVPGDYVVQLVTNDGINNTPASPPGEVVVRVSPALRGTSFISDISPIFERCAVCHLGFDNPRFNNLPTLYENVINFVNTDDPVYSPILLKPSGQHHAGGTIQGFESTVSQNYKLVLRWILEGAQDN